MYTVHSGGDGHGCRGCGVGVFVAWACFVANASELAAMKSLP